MTKVLRLPTQSIEYDFVLEYPYGVRPGLQMGDRVDSGVKDGMGTVHTFTGHGLVVATAWSDNAAERVRERIYVRNFRPGPV